jgi:putative transposase
MASTRAHRKQIKHYHERGHCHELTFSCYDRRPLLTNNSWREMLARCIDSASSRHAFRTVAFVFMPEHVHLLVYPDEATCNIDEFLKAIKRPFAFRIKKLLAKSNNSLLKQLTIRQRPGVMTFRFWQEGPGYDRNLTHSSSALAAIDYIHNNPVRRGLVERAVDWKWSSARFFVQADARPDPKLPAICKLPAEFLS